MVAPWVLKITIASLLLYIIGVRSVHERIDSYDCPMIEAAQSLGELIELMNEAKHREIYLNNFLQFIFSKLMLPAFTKFYRDT